MNRLKSICFMIGVSILSLILALIIVSFLSCSEAPFEPVIEEQNIVDSLTHELYRTKLSRDRWSYIVQCNYKWFLENGIEQPCHGNPIPAMTLNILKIESSL